MNKRWITIIGLTAIVTLACAVNLPFGQDPTATVEPPTTVPTDVPVEVPTEAPTETPLPEPTATPEPTEPLPPPATETGDPTESVPSETYLIDDFSDPNNQIWVLELITDAQFEGFEYRDGRLFLFNNYATEDAFGITQATYFNFPQDIAATVDIEFVADASIDGEAGFVFRVGLDFIDYEFTITPEGLYSIYKYNGEFVPLADYTFSDLIRTGAGAINQLTVLAQGSNLTFIINGTVVEEIIDDDIQGTDFGLVVYNFDDIGTSAYFDNLIITSITAYQAAPPALP